MTPTPTPTPITPEAVADTLAGFGIITTAVAVVVVAAAVILFGAMLMRASRYAWPVPIIAPLAMLSLVFGLAGVFVSELIPLAGAGVGALAGVLTARLGKGPGEPPSE
jgi:energy-converting hydrogenase Eha subunit A